MTSSPDAPTDMIATPTATPQAEPTVYESVLMLELTELKQKTADEVSSLRKHIETQQLMIGQLRGELQQLKQQRHSDDDAETRTPGTFLLRDTPAGAAQALGLTQRRAKHAATADSDSNTRIISAEGSGIVRPKRTAADKVDTVIMVFACTMLLIVLCVAISAFFLPWITMPQGTDTGVSPRRAPSHTTPMGRHGAGYKG